MDTKTPETSAAWAATIAWLNSRDQREDPRHVALANLAEEMERERDSLASALRELTELPLCGAAYEIIEKALTTKPTPCQQNPPTT